MTATFDLAVVGAGPAGSLAALRARRLAPGLRVALIDAAEFPRDKACGDGLGPEAVSLLRRASLGQVLGDSPPLHRVRIVAPSGEVVEGDAPRAGHVIPRVVFDARLRDAAIAAGAVPIRARVRRLTQDVDAVTLDDGLSARWVIGADGANSVVRRLVGAGASPAEHVGLAIRAYGPEAERETLEIAFVPDRWPAYAWAFPVGDGTVNVGYGPFDGTKINSRRQLTTSLERWMPSPVADPSTLRAHHLPVATRRPAPVHGRVLLAGDAASLINPLTGEGIGYAMISGALAGAAVATRGSAAGTVYRRWLRARLGMHLRQVSIAAGLLRRSPALLEVAVRAAGRDVRTFADLCELSLGTGLFTPRIVAGMTRAAAHRYVRVVPES